MQSQVIVSFTVVNGAVLYRVPDKVNTALQLIAEMQQNKIPGSVTIHIDPSGNAAKVKQERFL